VRLRTFHFIRPPLELFALRRNDVKGEFIRIDEVLIMGRIKNVEIEQAALGIYVSPDLLLQLTNRVASTDDHMSEWLFPASRTRNAVALSDE
jgi:hypothetical protein